MSMGGGWRLRAHFVRAWVSGVAITGDGQGVSMSGDWFGGGASGEGACDQEIDLEQGRGLAVGSTHFLGLLVWTIG